MAEIIYLVRHGEAESNEQKYFAGHLDAQLTSLGRKQSLLLKKRLSHEKIGFAFCSDLSRAKGTLEALTLPCPVEFTPLLREKSYGELEGVRWGDEEEKFAAHHSDPFLAAPGGESFASMQARVVEFFQQRILAASQKEVLVVSHHGPIVALACHLLSIPLEKWRVLRMGNCGLSILTREDGMWRLKLWNSLSQSGLESFKPLFKPGKN
jgi:broad specificity phosphatase PhoE